MMKKNQQKGLEAVLVKRLAYFTLNVTITCAPGQTLVLTGPSGSGKSTILRCLAGLEAIDEGYVHFDGTCWNDAAAGVKTRTQSREVGFLSQEFDLFPHMTLSQNIRFAMQQPADPVDLLDSMGISHLRDKRPHQISGGERQRAALCQTLARAPRLLLLDEPFSALDMENRLLLRQHLRRAQARWGLPIIQVTHDLAEALTLSRHIVSLHRGQEDNDWLQRQKALFLNNMQHLQRSSDSGALAA